MCTLVVAFYPGSETPLVIGANRDESPTRPSEDWAFRKDNYSKRDFRFCPLDVPSKGSWIGVNVAGLFCALTNWDLEENKSARRGGRGGFVYDVLGFPEPEMVVRWAEALSAKDFKPFNVIIGNDKSLYRIGCDGFSDRMIIDKLSTGLYTSTGFGFNSFSKREVYLKTSLVSEFCDFSQPVNPKRLKYLLAHHNEGVGSEHSICVHDDEHRWQTRSSCVITLEEIKNTMFFKVVRTLRPPCDSTHLEYKDFLVSVEKKS